MKKQTFICLFAAAFVLTGAAACANKEPQVSVTTPDQKELGASELLELSKEELGSVNSLSANLDLYLNGEYTADGTTVPVSEKIHYEYVSDAEDHVHLTGTVTVNQLEDPINSELYLSPDGTAYELSGEQWVKYSKESAGGSLFHILEELAKKKKLELAETGEKDVFTVTGTLSVKELQEAAVSFLPESGNVTATAWVHADGTLKALRLELQEGFTEDTLTVSQVVLSLYGIDRTAGKTAAVPSEIAAAAVEKEGFTAEVPLNTSPFSTESEGSLPEPLEDGAYELGNKWDENVVLLKVPNGFALSSGSDSQTMIFYSLENDGDREVTITYTMITADENYTEANLSGITDRDFNYMTAKGDYSLVEMGGEEKTTAGGKSCSFKTLSWLYLGTIYGEEIDIWTVYPDGRMLRAEIKEKRREAPCSLLEEGSLMETAMAAAE